MASQPSGNGRTDMKETLNSKGGRERDNEERLRPTLVLTAVPEKVGGVFLVHEAPATRKCFSHWR